MVGVWHCVILLFFSCSAAGVKVGFGEADYAKKEETGFLEVFVAKTGSNSGTIVIRITPLTFTQYMEMFTVTPPYINVPEDANYAEVEDFDPTPKDVTIQPSNENTNFPVQIDIMDDDAFEPREVFLLHLEVMSFDSNLDSEVVVLSDTTLVAIRPDEGDKITVGLSQASFEVEESVGSITGILYIQATGTAEEVLTVTLDFPFSDGGARIGEDFTVLYTQYQLRPPTVSQVPVYIIITDDSIPEEDENFHITLRHEPESYTAGQITRSSVTITDNDPASFGFNQSTVDVVEGAKAKLCVTLSGAEQFQKFVVLELMVVQPGNATEDVDFKPLDPKRIFFDNIIEKCIEVETIGNDKEEPPRVFTVQVSLNPASDKETNKLTQDTVTVVIVDNDGPPKPSAPKSLTAKFENGDLSISWEADDTELNPASFYSGTITFNDTSARKREANVITFETVETGYTAKDVDTSKDYEIEVCAHNDGGQSCTDPYYLEGEPASLRESDESDDTNPGTITLAIIIPLLIVVGLLILVLLFLIFVRIHNWDSYSPEDKEKKFSKERSKQPVSEDDSDDFEFHQPL